MTKLNLEFIGEIVSSPSGMCSWSGTTVRFWGKFKEGKNEKRYSRFTRDNLIEAIAITEERPSKEYHRCSAFQVVPEKYMYEVNETTSETGTVASL
jgi:hypothetical protein